jgi:hypothetical protein
MWSCQQELIIFMEIKKMSLTKQHFEDLAQLIGDTDTYEELAFQLKGFCKRHNTNFNVVKFNNYIIKIKNLKEVKSA